ncbi:MAG TPA: peptidase [Calditrichaeota bacterium]|nr:peptidase [Calditrichota bacterium]
MESTLKPIFLLADSQPLFKTYEGQYLLADAHKTFTDSDLLAAYIGASNDDNPAYYEIFTYAMQPYALEECRMIRRAFSAEDRDFLQNAHIILLAGGDTRKGWRWMEEKGVVEIIRERYVKGGLLIGVSAGAIQLGICGHSAADNGDIMLFETLKLVPFCIDAHREKNDWAELKKALRRGRANMRAFGLPFGSALVYHSEHKMQPFGPVDEFYVRNGNIYHNLLLPDNEHWRVT